jgi:hypothetical protein
MVLALRHRQSAVLVGDEAVVPGDDLLRIGPEPVSVTVTVPSDDAASLPVSCVVMQLSLAV